MIGETIGNYRVTGEIGAGGMGTVYATEHQLIGRKAALKMLLPDLSASKRQVQRFFNEAKAASAIRHPGIVEIFDFGFHHGQAFILMEYLEGESLQARLRRDSVLSQHGALHLLRQVSGCLAAAHEQGIIHRDLKPDNIFIVADPEVSGGERVKLLDFGIAKLSGDQANDMKTRTGTVMGTPAYMSPEQCRGAEQVDHRSDLYSLGCILYRMLCGQPPFVSKYSGDILAMQIMYDPPEPRTLVPDMSPPVAAFIMRLLSKDPAIRPQSARALMAEIDQLGHVTLASGMHGRMPTNHEHLSHNSQGPPLTTLAGSAGMVAGIQTVAESRPRRRRAPVIVGLLAVAAAVVVALFAAGVFSGESSQSVAATQPVKDTEPGADKVPDTPPDERAAGDDDSAPNDPAPADKRTITIASKPAGATVKRGDEELGVTPLELDALGADGANDLTLTVSLAGFIDETVAVADALDENGHVQIDMQPAPAPDPETDASAKQATDDKSGATASTSTKTGTKSGKKRSGKKKSGKKKSGKKKSGKKKSGSERDEDGFLLDGV